MAKSSGKTVERRADGMPIGKPFPKGKSPNPAGRPKGLRNSKTILTELLQVTEHALNPMSGNTEEMTQLDQMWAEQVVRAKRGDGYSLDRIVNRLEGSPEQRTKADVTNTNLNVATTLEALQAAPDELIEAIAKVIKGSRTK